MINQPQFGSIYEMKLTLNRDDADYYDKAGKLTRTTAQVSDLEGVSIIQGLEGAKLALDGETKTYKFKSKDTIHFVATGSGSEIDRSPAKASKVKEVLSSLPVVGKFVKADEPMTVEEKLDKQVEAILEKNNVEYDKTTFEEI